MDSLRTKFLLSSFFLMACASACSNYYTGLTSIQVDTKCLSKIRPAGITRALYETSIDVFDKHISGILFIKTAEDKSKSIVFMNQSGLTLFHFEFDEYGKFSVRQIIEQLNKKAVVETLKKDFELLLAIPFQGNLDSWRHGDHIYFGTKTKSSFTYFSTTPECDSVFRSEIGSKRKRLVTMERSGSIAAQPETASINHLTFPMTIKLKKLQKDVDQ